MPHAGGRPDHGGISGAPRGVWETREGGGVPGISHLVWPEVGLWAHGCRACATPYRRTSVRAMPCHSAGIDKGPGGGPETPHDAHRGTTGRTAGHAWERGLARWRLVLTGVSLHHHQADGRGRHGTAGMEKADMPDFLQAIGQDVLEESPEKLHAVEVGGAEAGAAHLPGGEGDRAVRERDQATVGDGDLEDRRGEGGEGGVAVMIGLAVDVPRDGPDLGIALLQQSGVAHVFCAESPGDGGEGCDGDKEVGAGGTPGRAVRGEATARDHGVHVGVVLELPAPGM